MNRSVLILLAVILIYPSIMHGQHELGKIKTIPIPEIRLTRHSVLYLDRHMVPLNTPFTLSSGGFSMMMPAYRSVLGLPGYMANEVNPVSGKSIPITRIPFGLVANADSLYKVPTTYLFYQEGDYQVSSLSAFQYLPLSAQSLIRFGFESSGSFPQYFKNNEKDKLARVWFQFTRKKSEYLNYVITFDYFRNKGYDFTGYDRTEKVSTLLDFSRKFSFSLHYKKANLELGFTNYKFRGEDFLTIPNGATRDTISHFLYTEYENPFLKTSWKPGDKVKIWSRLDYFRGYKNKNLSNFHYATGDWGFLANIKRFQGTAGIRYRDFMGVTPFLGLTFSGRAKHVEWDISGRYDSRAIPFSFIFWQHDWQNHDIYWQKFFKIQTQMALQITDKNSIRFDLFTILPHELYTGYYTGEVKKTDRNLMGYLIQLDNDWGLGSTLRFEDFQDIYHSRIRRATCSGRISLSFIPRLPITGYFFLQFYFDYPHYSFILGTSEWIPVGKQDNPVVTNIYLSLPVKSSLLYAGWTNVLQQAYEWKNFDWTELVAFKFGFIWRLEQ